MSDNGFSGWIIHVLGSVFIVFLCVNIMTYFGKILEERKGKNLKCYHRKFEKSYSACKAVLILCVLLTGAIFGVKKWTHGPVAQMFSVVMYCALFPVWINGIVEYVKMSKTFFAKKRKLSYKKGKIGLISILLRPFAYVIFLGFQDTLDIQTFDPNDEEERYQQNARERMVARHFLGLAICAVLLLLVPILAFFLKP